MTMTGQDDSGLLPRLPNEIGSFIFQECTVGSLYNLALTCRRLRSQVCIRLKFALVDLSAHYKSYTVDQVRGGIMKRYKADELPLRFDVEDLTRRQDNFLNCLFYNPCIGTYVRKLTWTVHSNRILKGRLIQNSDPDARTWIPFKPLSNVSILDIGCYPTDLAPPSLHSLPSGLFPSVTKASLSGLMHPQMAIAILKASAPNITHLTLDNLQSPGHRDDQCPFTYGSAEYRPALTESPAMGLPGPIRGLLSSLQGRCDSLEFFRYRLPGCLRSRGDYFPGADESAYAELAAFLDSVRSSLQVFSFEHGVAERWMHLLPKQYKRSPMEDRFRIHVGKVLLYKEWAKLRRLNVVGVWKTQDFMSLEVQWRFGERVEGTFDIMPTRPCVMYGGNYDARHDVV